MFLMNSINIISKLVSYGNNEPRYPLAEYCIKNVFCMESGVFLFINKE